MSIVIRRTTNLLPGESMAEVSSVFTFDAKHTSRPGVNADRIHIGDAALTASLYEFRIGFYCALNFHELFQLYHRTSRGKVFN